ncbi:MAG: response regulator [Candidatus Flexifilum sp.]|jgi:CheY-like chemotaxis protein
MSRWIILEDEPQLYDVLMHFTEIFGVGGIGFANADQALDWIEDVDNGLYDGELPALALLDYRMENGTASGADVIRRLRSSPYLNNIAIVVMSAYFQTDEFKREILDNAQADLLLNKPLPTMYELRAILLEVVRKRGAAA